MKRHSVTSSIVLNPRIPRRIGRANKKSVVAAMSRDPADQIATKCLRDCFAGGKHLVLGNDGRFRSYRRGAWHLLRDEALKKQFYTVLNEIPGLKCRRIAGTLEDALELAKAKCAIHGPDPFRLTRTPRNIINLRNGELWLSPSGKATLKRHRSSSYQTHRLNFRYDPEAECPTYDRALQQIFRCAQDPKGLIKFWNEFLGYLVSADRSQKIIAIMSGTGDNGKTALANLICTMVGEDLAANFDIEKLGKSQFMMASLIGKRILVDDDVSSDALLPDGELKKISEVKRLTAERK
jgi:putative DNA primase/helicase